jgi:hypothetical protein
MQHTTQEEYSGSALGRARARATEAYVKHKRENLLEQAWENPICIPAEKGGKVKKLDTRGKSHSVSLEELKRAVKGFIEIRQLPDSPKWAGEEIGVVMNEEGGPKGLPVNETMREVFGVVLLGDVVLAKWDIL